MSNNLRALLFQMGALIPNNICTPTRAEHAAACAPEALHIHGNINGNLRTDLRYICIIRNARHLMAVYNDVSSEETAQMTPQYEAGKHWKQLEMLPSGLSSRLPPGYMNDTVSGAADGVTDAQDNARAHRTEGCTCAAVERVRLLCTDAARNPGSEPAVQDRGPAGQRPSPLSRPAGQRLSPLSRPVGPRPSPLSIIMYMVMCTGTCTNRGDLATERAAPAATSALQMALRTAL